MMLLRILGGLALAVLLLFAAGLAYLLLERWPTKEPAPYGRLKKDWHPNPRTIVRVV
jgi:hypothetical protein